MASSSTLRIGACTWTIGDGGGRFSKPGRPNFSNIPPLEKIALLTNINSRLRPLAEIFSKNGIPFQGIEGIEMHYPNEIDEKNCQQVIGLLKNFQLVASMVTPNLFYTFLKGSFMSTDEIERQRAIEYAKKTIDLAYKFENALSHLPVMVFWPGGEGWNVPFQIDQVASLYRYADAINQIMDYEKILGGRMLFAGEAKPNEPQGNIILPTTADFLAIRALLNPEYQKRFGANPETAHEMLANLSPVNPVATALALNSLFHYHANWQDGLKWDQDLGVPVNLQMLEIISLMKKYGFIGFIGLDVQPRPENKDPLKVILYSVSNLRILEHLETKIDWQIVEELRQNGDPEDIANYMQNILQTQLPKDLDPVKLLV